MQVKLPTHVESSIGIVSEGRCRSSECAVNLTLFLPVVRNTPISMTVVRVQLSVHLQYIVYIIICTHASLLTIDIEIHYNKYRSLTRYNNLGVRTLVRLYGR